MKNDNRPACGGWAPGKYLCKCRSCKQTYQGDKRSYFCADCAYEMASQPPGEPGRVLHTIFTPDNEGAIMTTRHEEAAKQIKANYLIVKDHPLMPPVEQSELADVIASHYRELEDAAVLARRDLAYTDAHGFLCPGLKAALDALNAVLSK